MSARDRLAVALASALFASVLAPSALAITRQEVMTRARAFAYHPWRMRTANQTASCNASYQSIYSPGDYMGLPYDWGGYMSLFEFDQQIAQGYGAGSYPSDGVLACTAGLDCSGFVSQAFGTGHYTTRNLGTIATSVAQADLLPGDFYNQSGYHVCLFSHRLQSGEPVFYESINYNVHVNVSGGWSWVTDYVPLRYRSITGTTDTNPLGTVTNPIPITAFPFHDSRDTRQSPSSVLDRCGAAPDKNESGPEYVYAATFAQPGTLTVSVSDDVGVDIDVHLYTGGNTSDCVARHDSTFTRQVDCGRYLIVADTYGAGLTNAGAYNLTVTFTPSGTACGAGPATYDFAGGPGDACEYPNHPELPFCNPNLGVDTCLYTSTSSFCTHACATTGDCGDLPGGCCVAIGGGERYCMPSNRCGVQDAGTMRPDAGILGGGDPDPDAGTSIDAGVADAGVTDAGVTDAGVTDAGLADGGASRDAGVVDAGVPRDAGTARDAGVVDGGSPRDAGVVSVADAGTARDGGARRDGGSVDGGSDGQPIESAPGGCSAGGARGSFGASWLAALWLAARRRRGSAATSGRL